MCGGRMCSGNSLKPTARMSDRYPRKTNRSRKATGSRSRYTFSTFESFGRPGVKNWMDFGLNTSLKLQIRGWRLSDEDTRVEPVR